MDLGTIIGGVIVAILAFFGINAVKNKKASQDYKDALDAINGMNVFRSKNRAAMEFEENERKEAKEKLETELAREVTDEEIVDYLNDRYRNS